jgi:hypothetical protein
MKSGQARLRRMRTRPVSGVSIVATLSFKGLAEAPR